MHPKATVSISKGDNVKQTVQSAVGLIGGMTDIIHRGDQVILKPNLAERLPPSSGLTTDLNILGELATMAFKAGAEHVILAEGSATSDLEQIPGLNETLERTGMEAVDLNKVPDKSLVDVRILNPYVLREIRIPRVVLESDVFINVPKLKVGGFVTSLGIKNLLGVLRGKGSWSDPETMKPPFKPAGDKKILHSFGQSKDERFQEAVIDLNSVVRSDMIVVDGFYGLEGEGTAHGRPVKMDLIIAGKDIVAVDAISSMVMGFDPAKINYIRLAVEKGLGIGDPAEIQVEGIPVSKVRRRFKPRYPEYKRYYSDP